MTKKALLMLVTVIAAMGTAPARAVLPVIDQANLHEAVVLVQSAAEQLTTLQTQLDTLKSQFETITNLYEEARGVTEHATMLADSLTDFHDFIPEIDFDLDDVLTGSIGDIADDLRDVKELVSLESLKDIKGAHQQSLDLYKEKGDVVYAYMALAKNSLDSIRERKVKLDSFREAAGTANTAKAVNDLNARISAEMLAMLNDIAEIQALTLMSQMERANIEYNEAGLSMYRTSQQ